MSSPQVLIIADDLTGAADSAVAFAAHGLPASVSLGGALPDTPVVAVDTDTRRSSAGDAAAAVQALVARARNAGMKMLYKKVDSTLRGNIPAELAALISSAEGRLCLFAPAFPATGRTTRDGVPFVDGIPLAQTRMWRLARQTPPDNIPSLLAPSGLDVVSMALSDVRGGVAKLGDILNTVRSGRAQVAVFDAETDEDLAVIARAGLQRGDPVVWAGSGGLAAQLAAQLPGRPVQAHSTTPGRVLAVVGSASERAAAQADALAGAGLRRVTVDAPALLSGDRGGLEAATQELAAALAGQDVLVTLAEGNVIGQQDAGRRAVTALADVLAPALPGVDTLVVTGGETARALLTAVGAPSFQLLGELEAGVVHGRAAGPARTWGLVTKAGAFGDAGVLVRALRALEQNARTAAG